MLCAQLSWCVLSDQVKKARKLFKTDPKALEADEELAKIWEKLQASKREMYKANIVVT